MTDRADRFSERLVAEKMVHFWDLRDVGMTAEATASTISRELRRGVLGRNSYRAAAAHRIAFNNARRPKPAKLLEPGPLRDRVKADLVKWLSPEQISGRLKQEHRHDPRMQISHESIYQGIYRARPGRLVRRLEKVTRTGRAVRKPRRNRNHRTGRIQNMSPLTARTSDADNRLVPGHWEGDLVRHEALFYRAEVEDLRLCAVAAA